MKSASAPGKIILSGEHAVVYGRPALAVPVSNVQATVEVSTSTQAGIWIDAPEIHLRGELKSLPLDDPLASAIQSLLFLFHIDPYPDLRITIRSTIPVAAGLGSGAAVSVALTRALAAFLGKAIRDEQVNALAFEIEKLHHGTPSGIDNTVITYARPVYFLRDQPIESFRPGVPFTIVIGDTGIAALTKESVADVRQLWQQDPILWEGIFDEVAVIVNEARMAIELGKMKELGSLMNRNHELLQQMTVSSPELDHLVEAARGAGALGAKMSGGGRGGNMIALMDPSESDLAAAAMKECLLRAGARHVITTLVR